jgi:site-specific recombinase XerD
MTTGMLVSADLRVMEVGTTARNELVLGFLDHLRGTRAAGTLWSYGAAARHFLFWLAQRGIPVISVDDTVVGRFARHRCRCHRYNPRALSGPLYLSRVRKFGCFLEERGDIPTNDNLDATAHLADLADHLDAVGYSGVSRRGYRSEAEHFACWLRLTRVQWRDVNDEVVDRFARHDCHCPIRRKRGVLADRTGSAHRRRGASRFIGFLQRRAVILPVGRRSEPVEDPRLSAFRVWLRHHRGASGETVRRYLQEASRWLPALGVDPTAYDAATIRNVVLDQDPGRSRTSVQMTTTVLRSYLRFLAARGECRPELVHAVPPAPRRRLAMLPRYVGPAVIERIIASCDAATPIGIRDRAIILLLARLGLRAGDIWRLRIADIDWAGALLHLYGKGRRSVSLPLPQDVGDAPLAYLEQARPKVSEERVFLCIQAPFTPFLSSSEIAGIVARVLARGGIDGVPTGAHLFRHSLATAMLRAGGSLESVGAVLRHRTPDTTAIHAKVDVAMLESVAQPWPGEVPC